MTIYPAVNDYADSQVWPALMGGDEKIDCTEEQALEIARRCTEWHDEYTASGDIRVNKSGYVERQGVDVWDVVAEVLND